MLEELEDILVRGFAVAGIGWILYHLIMLKFLGTVTIFEPNASILSCEIVFTLLVFLLCARRLVKYFRRG